MNASRCANAFAGAGSVAVHTVNSTVEALLEEGSVLTASTGSVIVNAEDHTGIFADAGGFAIAIATDGAAGAIGYAIALQFTEMLLNVL